MTTTRKKNEDELTVGDHIKQEIQRRVLMVTRFTKWVRSISWWILTELSVILLSTLKCEKISLDLGMAP